MAKSTRKPRDYKAEYARRVRNAESRGLSRSQARGHAREKQGELPATVIRKGNLPPWLRIRIEQGQTVVRLPHELDLQQRESILAYLREKGKNAIRLVYRHPGEESHGGTSGWVSIRTEPDRELAEQKMEGKLHYPRREREPDQEEETEIDDEYGPDELAMIVAI